MSEKLDELQKALNNQPKGKDFKTWKDMAQVQEEFIDGFARKFAVYRAELDLPLPVWLKENAKTLLDIAGVEGSLVPAEELKQKICETHCIGICPSGSCSKFEQKWVSVPEIQPYLTQILRDKTVAEEKNVEYAKLVAGQAQEYAEKIAAKEQAIRKLLEDIFSSQRHQWNRTYREKDEIEYQKLCNGVINELESRVWKVFDETFSEKRSKGSGEGNKP